MSKIYKFKWFVWSDDFKRYLPISGMYPDNRGEYRPTMVDFFGEVMPPMFSIPLFNTHDAAKRLF